MIVKPSSTRQTTSTPDEGGDGQAFEHVSVLLAEAVDALQLQPGDTVIDVTIGGGGHSSVILQSIGSEGHLIGFDQDAMAIDHVKETLGTQYPEQLTLIHDNFSNVRKYEAQFGTRPSVSAVLLDLGVSYAQIRSTGRGFSFTRPDDPLDMRMDQRGSTTVEHIVNSASHEDLTIILKEYGEEPYSRRIAQAIVSRREEQPLSTVGDLLECVARGYRGKKKPKRHMATKTFQALRIAVNQELERLPSMLHDAVSILSSGGRLAVITFHSLEDRIVKHTFRTAARDCICEPEIPICVCTHKASVKRITKKPILPTEEELTRNPKSRSAKLRIIEKL